MAYRGKVLSLDVPKEKLSTIGAGLVFPDATARHFWTNLKIHYSVAVASKKSIKKKNNDSSSQSSSSKTSDKQSNAKKEKSSSANSNSEVSKIHVSASAHSLSSPAISGAGSGAPVRTEPDSTTTAGEDVKETPC